MANSYWLVNTSRSEVRRFKKNTDTGEVIFPYMSVDYGKIVGVFGKDAPVMQRRIVLKVVEGRQEWKKLIAQGWRRTEEVWTKKEGLSCT